MPKVNRENLVGIKDPYIHSRAATFNMAAYAIDVAEFRVKDGPRKIEGLLSNIESRLTDCRKKESDFYKAYGVNNEYEWSERYLASLSETAGVPQIALSVWNSRGMIETLLGKLNGYEALEVFQSLDIAKEYKDEWEELADRVAFFFETHGHSTDALSWAFAKEIESQSGDFQKNIRQAFGIDRKSNYIKTLIQGEVQNISKRTAYKEIKQMFNKTRIRDKQNRSYNYFCRRLKDTICQVKGIEKDHFDDEVEIAQQYKDICAYFHDAIGKAGKATSDWLYRSLVDTAPNVTGGVGEVGMGYLISYQATLDPNLDTGEIESMYRNIGQKTVDRFGYQVDSKTDIVLNKNGFGGLELDKIVTDPKTGFRIQSKNTNKNIFLGLEKQIKELSVDPFFDIHGEIEYTTFLDNIQKIKDITIDNDVLASLSYLLANVNVLSHGTALSERKDKKEDKKNRGYKAWNRQGSAPGQLVNYAQIIISRMISTYIIYAIADFSKEDHTAIPYDFIIFDSRVLIPVSYIYEGLIENIKQTTFEIQKQQAHLTVRSSIKGSYNLNDLHNRKKSKIKLDPSLETWYEDTPLTDEGRAEGEKAVSNLVLSGMQLDVNIENLVNINMKRK